MPDSRSLYRQHDGGWCDNCETAYPFIPKTGQCPSCGGGQVLRPARITVEPLFCNWCPNPESPDLASHPGGQAEHVPSRTEGASDV